MAQRRPNPTIVMTPPPGQSGARSSPHPRRPPAYRSVSLKHSPHARQSSKKSDSSSSEDQVKGKVPTGKTTNGQNSNGSPSSLQPGRDSSGESSNAEKWFEASNNEVQDPTASFADNDPPFFMRNSSSSETPPDAPPQELRNLLAAQSGSNSLPMRTGLLNLGTDGSSTEDFRSVIDDLTVENKNLKRKLKKFEKLHDSHLKDEKLFEVRIHGLPPHKKRELEETLRSFAASLGPSGFASAGYEAILPSLAAQKTTSSQTSMQNDSTYASASGQGSSALSGYETGYKNGASTSVLRKQNIHTYLHHIPEGLMPQQNAANMSDRTKKKVVARRLEQIFAGKGVGSGGHQHSMQQQEVSQSAARADRAAGEAQGLQARQEGSREALIMARDRRDPVDQTTNYSNSETNAGTGRGPKRAFGTVESEQDHEQRPTRPLDLDPHRASVPADNIEYMRHLGFSPQDPGTSSAPEDGHSWIYLNLLINMAQLHTINVTTEFVRKALEEHSHKFEISHDGRKVRWKGGTSETHSSSNEGGSSSRLTDLTTPEGQSPRKRPKLIHRGTVRSHGSGSSLRPQPDNKLMYTPMFFHKDSTDDETSEEEDSSTYSPYPAPAAGDSSGMTSSGVRTTSTKKKKRTKNGDDGPIIFYNNARFCTDLSGDRKSNGNANAPPYTPASTVPVGKPQTDTSDVVAEKRGPLAEAKELPEPMDLDDNPIPESMELVFPHLSPMSSMSEDGGFSPAMEVTGIGGVWPADHFSILVESRHARIDQQEAPLVEHQKAPPSLPTRISHILDEAGEHRYTRAAVHKIEVARTKVKNYPASSLPAALSYMPFSEDSYEDELSDDEMSVSPESPGDFPPATALQPVDLHYASSEEGDEENDDDDDDDDESDSDSLDLLAAARELDPEAVMKQEREYDAQYAERLADEVPVGSSAATAGGGSGFASPASNTKMSADEHQKAVRNARGKQPLERKGTSGSMKALDPHQPAPESDDDEDVEMEDSATS